jgi:hypothetical protein
VGLGTDVELEPAAENIDFQGTLIGETQAVDGDIAVD